MNNPEFRIEAPPVPQHFIETRERTLERIQRGEALGASPRRLTRSVVLAIVLALMLATGAAAAANHFGILEFLNWNHMPTPAGADGAIRSSMSTVDGELYTASAEESYFDGRNFMLTVQYELKNPQDALFVNNLSGYWRDDEGFYRVGMTCEISGPEDPWQTINEYEDATGGTRTRVSAIDPAIVLEDDLSWGSAVSMFHQPDGSLLYVLQGMLNQPEEGPLAVTIRCGVVTAVTEKPTGFEEISVVLEPSETAWTAQYVPEAAGDGWTVEHMSVASGRLLAQAEIEFTCAPGTLTGNALYWDIEVRDESDAVIAMMDGMGETEKLPDGGIRCLGNMSLLFTDGRPDTLKLYLRRDDAPMLGPIECRLTDD